MDVIEVLTEDHRAVNRAFLRYEDAAEGLESERREAFVEIHRRLAWHTATEERFLHPLLAAHLPHDHDQIAGDVGDHRQLAGLLRSAARAGDAERAPIVGELIAATRKQMEREERELFPMLRLLVEQEELVRLGRVVADAREEDTGQVL